MAIQKRMVIAALVPLLGAVIALSAEQDYNPTMSAEQDYNPTMAQYMGSVYAIAILIAAWEFMFWIIKASWSAERLRIPLALAIITGWWAYGMVTLNFSTMESPYTGDTTQMVDAMLSALPLIPINGLIREMAAEWKKTGELSGEMFAVALTTSLPIKFSSLILFFTVPLGWVTLAVGRARKTHRGELLWKILWKIRRRWCWW